MPSCRRTTKAQSYIFLVRPTLEHSSSVWDPHAQKNIKRLEAVQRRAAGFVVGDYLYMDSLSQMIQDLGWQSLQRRRSNSKLIMVYRIVYGLVDIPAASFFLPTALNTQGHSLCFLIPYCWTYNYTNSFFPSGILRPDKRRWAVLRLSNLAKFNLCSSTFGIRLVRLHCLLIHPSVKYAIPIIYTCSIVKKMPSDLMWMNLISLMIYAQSGAVRNANYVNTFLN